MASSACGTGPQSNYRIATVVVGRGLRMRGPCKAAPWDGRAAMAAKCRSEITATQDEDPGGPPRSKFGIEARSRRAALRKKIGLVKPWRAGLEEAFYRTEARVEQVPLGLAACTDTKKPRSCRQAWIANHASRKLHSSAKFSPRIAPQARCQISSNHALSASRPRSGASDLVTSDLASHRVHTT